MTDGIILIDKPAGITSFGVVARVRRLLTNQQSKKVKVGHTGTLDPFATGLMILVIGKECKNAGSYSKLDKVYEATIKLGQISTTGDPEGDLSDVSDAVPTLIDVKEVLQKFVGVIEQRPPAYSAIKVNGRRSYDLARSGQAVELPVRQVTIHTLDLIDYTYPELKIKTHVSSGTYIRSLASDIGDQLSTGAYCTSLRRVKIADWTIDQAKTLPEMGIVD